jgi:acyl dehydratase
MRLAIDRALVGSEFDRTEFPPISEEQILAYAASYGEISPLYTDPAAAAARTAA